MRLVDAKPIVEEFWKPEYRTQTRRDFIAVIDKSPTINAVPVVRCRECRYFGKNEENDTYCASPDGMNAPTQYGFCSNGKRKDGAE